MPHSRCYKCKKLRESPNHRIHFTFHDKLFENTVGDARKIKRKQDLLDRFLRTMNALLNEGGGIVSIHTDTPRLLGSFDELIDEKLKRLIPDDTCFHENFERHYDGNHVVFRVVSRERPLSTMKFDTKVSLNKGLDDPTHFQMRRLLRMNSDRQPEPKIRPPRDLTLYSNEEVKVKVGEDEFIFQESASVQAKRVPVDVWNGSSRSRSMTKLVEYCFQKVSPYITAFSKLPEGGSVLFGIADKKTREFICEGVQLGSSEQVDLRDRLLRRLYRKMLWFPALPDGPVDVIFHPVCSAPSTLVYVVELTVKKFHGMCFISEQGPLSYELAKSEPTVLDINKWVKLNVDAFSDTGAVEESCCPSPSKKRKK